MIPLVLGLGALLYVIGAVRFVTVWQAQSVCPKCGKFYVSACGCSNREGAALWAM